jgi:restriction system protein
MLLALLLLTLIVGVLIARRAHMPLRHRWRRRQARTMCIALRGADSTQPPPRIYARLRAIDALAFEELLLESFAMRGHQITRNHRYTRDGGVDGQVTIAGRTWFVQAKRYASAIRPDYIEAFAQVCRRHRKLELFIHTRRTGGLSRSYLECYQYIELISGERLLALITGGPLVIGGVAI